MTVSVALRGQPGVSKEKAEEIRQLAKKMGYVQNPLVNSLMRCRTMRRVPEKGLVLGWIGPVSSLRKDQRKKYPDQDVFASYVSGAEEVCAQRGFRLEHFQDPNYTNQQLSRILRARGIQGVVLGPQGSKYVKTDMSFAPIHAVQIGRSRGDRKHDRVATDAFHDMRHLVNILKQEGYRRIGYVDHFNHQLRSEDRWLSGFMLEADENSPPPWLRMDNKIPPLDYLSAYFERYRPDALIMGGRSFVRALVKGRLPIPFACLHRNGYPDWISGIDTHPRKVGIEATQLLIDKVLGPQAGSRDPRTLVLSNTWHHGKSHQRGFMRTKWK